MNPQKHRTTPGGVVRGQDNALIGVELTYISPSGESEELMMLVPPNGRFLLPSNMSGQYARMQVTLHLSDGDRTAQIQL